MAMTEASVDTSPVGIALGDDVSLDLIRLIKMWPIVQANNDGGDHSNASAQCAPALEWSPNTPFKQASHPTLSIWCYNTKAFST